MTCEAVGGAVDSTLGGHMSGFETSPVRSRPHCGFTWQRDRVLAARVRIAAVLTACTWWSVPTFANAEPKPAETAVQTASVSTLEIKAATESDAASSAAPIAAMTVRTDLPARASRDGRVSFGEFSISRPRFEAQASHSPVVTQTVTAPAPPSSSRPDQSDVNEAVSGAANANAPAAPVRAPHDPSVIMVPANTLSLPTGGSESAGSGSRESLQTRRDREAAERKRLEAEASEAEARAELTRLDAANYERNSRRPTIIVGGRGYYSGGGRYGHSYRSTSHAPHGLVHDRDRHSVPGEFTVTRQRFKGSKAQSDFARAASRDDIVPIQRRIDAAVRGNRLELEPVEE